MDVFIPLHQGCISAVRDTYIPVLLEKANKTDETYLALTIDDRANFDCQIGQGGGRVRTKPALYYATRPNRDDSPETDFEFYTDRGKHIASSLHFGSAIEYLAAWLNEDRKQANFCHDVHAVMALGILDKCPKWIRYDLMSILESESMKPIFSTRFFKHEKTDGFRIPTALRNALKSSADGITNPLISTLLSELTQKPITYNGSAKIFDDEAQSRIKLFERI
jgi:hypothetical protein